MNNTEENKAVDLNEFANMAGFPVELIKKELFENSENAEAEVSLESLREAMINYLNKNMMEE